MGSGPSGVIVDYTYEEEPEEEDEKANDECGNQCVHGDLSNGGEGDRSSARGAAGGARSPSTAVAPLGSNGRRQGGIHESCQGDRSSWKQRS